MTNAEYVRRVLAAWERCDLYDELMWRVDGETVRMFATCSDLFYWGTADAEEITVRALDLLDACVIDLEALDAGHYLPELFSARKRGMRPQTPFGRTYGDTLGRYEIDDLAPALRSLFDACGPVRDPKDEG